MTKVKKLKRTNSSKFLLSGAICGIVAMGAYIGISVFASDQQCQEGTETCQIDNTITIPVASEPSETMHLQRLKKFVVGSMGKTGVTISGDKVYAANFCDRDDNNNNNTQCFTLSHINSTVLKIQASGDSLKDDVTNLTSEVAGVSSAVEDISNNYAKKQELNAYYLKASGEDLQSTVERIPGTYATKQELNNIGDAYYLKASGEDLQSTVERISNDYVKTTELNDYVKTSALTTTLRDYVTDSALTTTLRDYVTDSALTTTLRNYVTDSALTNKLNNYVSTGDVASIIVEKLNAQECNDLKQAIANIASNPTSCKE